MPGPSVPCLRFGRTLTLQTYNLRVRVRAGVFSRISFQAAAPVTQGGPLRPIEIERAALPAGHSFFDPLRWHELLRGAQALCLASGLC
jgi:hypothetical protein